MQTIDLIHPEKGNVKYEVICFPDGQRHFKVLSEIDRKENITIICRICNAEDLFLMMQALDVVNRHGINPEVNIAYLMGARMDRIMSFNEPFTLDVVVNALNRFKADFSVLELHNLSSIKRGEWFGVDFDFDIYNKVRCFPDKGAYDRSRFMRFYRSHSQPQEVYCIKKRDVTTGKLSGFELYCGNIDINNKDVAVTDDLIDGGGTFCGIAPLLREKNPASITLSVCHAIQLEGIKRVAEVYDQVIITNSYKDWELEDLPANVKVNDILSKMRENSASEYKYPPEFPKNPGE